MDLRSNLHTSHHLFDNEQAVLRTGNTPSPVNLRHFQERIDAVTGKTVDGLSKVRIVWGMDWERGSMMTCGRRRLKYPFYHTTQNGEITDIGVPRFYIEELHTKAELQAGDRWEKARYTWEDGQKLDLLGEVPEDGFYTGLFMIAYHDELCCNGREIVKDQPCLGAFRLPNDLDLLRIRRMLWERDHASNDELAPSETLLQKRAEETTQKRNEKWRAGIRETIRDYMNTHAFKWTSHSDKLARHGKYTFLSGSGRGGLSPEEIKRLRERSAVKQKETLNADSNSECAA